jgi:predicted transcriptional regulator
MSSRINELGELQLAVLNVLWTRQQATVHEVVAALPSERKPAYTTILTVLRKLETHGLVTHQTAEGERMFRYRPLVTAHEARDHILQDVMQRLFAGSPILLVKHLLQTEGYTLAELRDLKATIAAQEQAITGTAAL